MALVGRQEGVIVEKKDPILDTRISVLRPSPYRSQYPPPLWILKRGGLESSGLMLIYLDGKTKIIVFFGGVNKKKYF